MDDSENSGTPKSSILIVFSIINHPFCGTPSFGNTHNIKKTPFSPKRTYQKADFFPNHPKLLGLNSLRRRAWDATTKATSALPFREVTE